MTDPILELRHVSKRFAAREDISARLARVLGASPASRAVHAVDRVDLVIRPGEVIGLAGESGCGKSTLGRIVAGLHEPTSGERLWRGKNVLKMTAVEAKRTRLSVQMIFQDPYASLNPRLRVADIVGEAAVVHGIVARARQRDYVAELLQRVGLDASLMRRFPHQFSGGQRARIGIARALAVQPEFLVCDEAVAALDVSIQAQVLNVFLALREQLGLTYLFISHDLGVVRHLSDRVAIMYLGRIVESAPAAELFAGPLHPYTRALLAEIPRLDVRRRSFVAIKGEIPSPLAPPSGCHFHPRCPHIASVADGRCGREQPGLREISTDRFVACHLNLT